MKLALALTVSLGTLGAARAGTPEDVEDLGARTIALGGAGAAIAADATALYYAPAALVDCAPGSMLVDLRHTARRLTVSAGPPAQPLADVTRATVGYCGRGPLATAVGLLLGSGLQRPFLIDQTTPDPTPRFVLHGDLQDQLTIVLGAARRLGPRLALGLGLAVLASSNFVLGADVPVLNGPDATVGVGLTFAIDPVVAPYLGAQLAVAPGVRLAATYRAPLFHDLAAATTVGATVLGQPLAVRLRLASVAWYSPRSLALGLAIERDALTVTGEVGWQGWSAYPGPFVSVRPDDPALGQLVRFPDDEAPGFRDAVLVRAGLELRPAGGPLALRGGLGYRSGIAGPPTGRARLLDGDVVAVSLGAGQRWAVGGARGSPDRVELGLDLFVRARQMLTGESLPAGLAARGVEVEHGGRLLDAGLTATVAWR